MSGERQWTIARIRLMDITMITDLIRSQCEQSWTAHGWTVCRQCSRTFGRHGASFSLKGAPGPHLLIDMDSIHCISQQRRCDYIFVADNLESGTHWVIPIELASGQGKERKTVVEQLQAGAILVEKAVGESASLNFVPVYIGKFRKVRGSRKHDRGMVRFQGKNIHVSVVKNGSSLAVKM